jgi:hypothetical protein
MDSSGISALVGSGQEASGQKSFGPSLPLPNPPETVIPRPTLTAIYCKLRSIWNDYDGTSVPRKLQMQMYLLGATVLPNDRGEKSKQECATYYLIEVMFVLRFIPF